MLVHTHEIHSASLYYLWTHYFETNKTTRKEIKLYISDNNQMCLPSILNAIKKELNIKPILITNNAEDLDDHFTEEHKDFISDTIFYTGNLTIIKQITGRIHWCTASVEVHNLLCRLVEKHKVIFPKIQPRKGIKILINTEIGLSTKNITINDLKELPIELLYGDTFAAKHNKVVEILNSNKNGLIFIHGEPGTGKSNYIYQLAGLIEDREFLFIPNGHIEGLISPNLLAFLCDYQNAVLIIEDAELALIQDEKIRSSLTSALLSLTDGFVGKSLGLTVIATFNTNLQDIDKALLRPGRLIENIEISKLNQSETQRLFGELYGGNGNVMPKIEPMTLAEIFNYSF